MLSVLIFIQHVSFPVLCRYSRGNTKLLGRKNQYPEVLTRWLTQSHSSNDTFKATETNPTNYNFSTLVMAVLVRNACCFDWSTRSMSPAPFHIMVGEDVRLAHHFEGVVLMPLSDPHMVMLGFTNKNASYGV